MNLDNDVFGCRMIQERHAYENICDKCELPENRHPKYFNIGGETNIQDIHKKDRSNAYACEIENSFPAVFAISGIGWGVCVYCVVRHTPYWHHCNSPHYTRYQMITNDGIFNFHPFSTWKLFTSILIPGKWEMKNWI